MNTEYCMIRMILSQHIFLFQLYILSKAILTTDCVGIKSVRCPDRGEVIPLCGGVGVESGAVIQLTPGLSWWGAELLL